MNEHTGSSISSAALMYAIATGYANYYTAQNPDADPTDENHPSKILENTVSGFGEEETPESVFTDLSTAFKTMALNGGNDLNTYLTESMQKDAAAYLETLRTVSATKNNIMDSNKDIGLGGNNYFSSDSVKGLLNKYAEGAIFVQIANGSVSSNIPEE